MAQPIRRTSTNPQASINVTNILVEISAYRILCEHLFKHRLRHVEALVDGRGMKLDLKGLRSRLISDRPQT
jgi:hypothetical protein